MKKILLIFSSLLFAVTIYGQNFEKDQNVETVTINRHFGDGVVSDPSGSGVQSNVELKSQVKELSKQLNQARINGDIQLMRELERQINDLVGATEASQDFGPQAIPLVESIVPTYNPETIGISVITPGAMWGQATTTQDTDGRIWVATTHFNSSDTDTLRIFYSDDNGSTWTYLNGYTYATTDLSFRTDDLDIEVLNNGTDWYVYVSGSYNYNGGAWGFVARYKDDGTGFFHVNLPKSSGTDQYWTRIVSDYPRWTSAAYLYIVATLDSVVDGSTRRLNLRAFVIQNPYAASPTVLDRNNNPTASAYWWQWGSAPTGATMKNDVAYLDSLSAGDRIVTCTIWENSLYDSALYMTCSDNYMATTPFVYYNFTMTYSSMRPIMSFNGGNDQLSGCIVTTRNYMNTADTDPRYIATNDGGASWMQGYIEATTDTTVKTDVIGLRGVDGHFKFAWLNVDAPDPEFLYRTGHLNGSMVQSSTVQMYGGGVIPNTTWGGRAGYRLAASDSCFAIFEGPLGVTAYGVSGCSGPVSVEDEELPLDYSLSQNYPNPFNPSTTISFTIPKAGIVKLVVYDILGKEVATLLNEEKIAGKYEVNFNVNSLASGIYFYTINAGSFTSTKKMILLK